ncbi:MAG: RNA methyltransferase, partial [Burkholderiales bacterium]
MELITSAQNPTLKLARKLLQSGRERQRSGKILLDGVHLISAYASGFGLSAATIIVDQAAIGHSPEIAALVDAAGSDTRVMMVPERIFADVSPVETPSGVIALCPQPEVLPGKVALPFWLLLDGIQNPGNLGSILRTSAATGVSRVLLSMDCADPWSPRCLRGGMGAQFVLPISTDVDPLTALEQFNGKSVATSSHAGQSMFEVDLSGPLIAVFGGEGSGLPASLLG